MIDTERRALQYVKNTNGGATKAHFMEDHEPIGERLWVALDNAGMVRVDGNGRIHTTERGDVELAA